MTHTREVVVIGGGIIGTSCAYYLSKNDWSVTLLQRGDFGTGCSYGNCGLVCPSHVLPLAAPGAWRSALASMFSKNSAFRIKPRFDFALWNWLFQFWRKCNSQDMMRAGKAIQALLNSSRQLYDELFVSEDIECEWQTLGLLFVFQTAAAMEHYCETNQLLSESFNMPATRYDGDQLIEIEPALKPGVAGAWHYKLDAHLRPDKLMTSWRDVLQNRGVKWLPNCEFLEFQCDSQRAKQITTSQGEIEADAFVVATGALTPLLNQQLGCKIPIQPGKGYSITMPRPSICPKYPLIFEEHHVAVTPMQSGYRIGSMMEFAGYDSTLNPNRLEVLKQGATHYLKEPYGDIIEDTWYGWRPMTYDSIPIIDRIPSMTNVYIAAGHNMLGLSMAPATGKIVAELLSEAKPHIKLEPYSLKRF